MATAFSEAYNGGLGANLSGGLRAEPLVRGQRVSSPQAESIFCSRISQEGQINRFTLNFIRSLDLRQV